MDRVDGIISRAFMGNEFLTWLWYRSEDNSGRFIHNEIEYTVWVDDQLSMASVFAESQEDSFKGGTPSTSPEARTALKLGKKVTRARFRISRGEQEWYCSLKGQTLDMGSVKLPAVLTKEEDDRFYERMMLIEELDGLITGLYEQFLQLRLTKSWKAELAAIKTWVKRPIEINA